MPKLYLYKNCDSCRKAKKWMTANGHDFEEIAIREQAPLESEFRMALNFLGGNVKKLFNVSGQDYRAANMKEKLPTLLIDDAIQMLKANGNMVKRPFLVSETGATAGFDESAWKTLLA